MNRIHSQRGGVFVTAVILGTVLFVAAGSVLSLTLSNYRDAYRKQLREQGQLVADSEFEKIYYEFRRAQTVDNFLEVTNTIATNFGNIGIDKTKQPTTQFAPFLEAHRQQGWKVKRSIYIDTTNPSVNGNDPETSRPTTFYFLQARVEVSRAGDITGPAITMKFARLMSKRENQLIDGAIYYQGDLELNPGGTVNIEGAIRVIGNSYIGPSNYAGVDVNIAGTLTYPTSAYLNQAVILDELTSGVYYNPQAPNFASLNPTFKAPIFTSNADQELAKSQQVRQTSTAENIFGGISATEIQAANSALFPDVNDVNRTPIVPPPGYTDEYGSSITADSEDVAKNRIFNYAGLVVNVAANGTISYLTRASNGTLGTLTNSAQITALNAAVKNLATNIYDERERRVVLLTEIDVSALNTALSSDFNGVMFVNVKGNTSTQLRGVRLINGETTFTKTDTTTQKTTGFTFATNTGLYIKGNYNTTAPAGAPSGRTVNPTALAADAITVLSPSWNDANAQNTDPADKNLPSRRADGLTTPSGASLPRMTINAAIVTGNSATSQEAGTRSGGVQNLIRYLEDWSGKEVLYHGTIARLFDSRHFSGKFTGNGLVNDVYNQPVRTFSFNSDLSNDGVPGILPSPTLVRGLYFAGTKAWDW